MGVDDFIVLPYLPGALKGEDILFAKFFFHFKDNAVFGIHFPCAGEFEKTCRNAMFFFLLGDGKDEGFRLDFQEGGFEFDFFFFPFSPILDLVILIELPMAFEGFALFDELIEAGQFHGV